MDQINDIVKNSIIEVIAGAPMMTLTLPSYNVDPCELPTTTEVRLLLADGSMVDRPTFVKHKKAEN